MSREPSIICISDVALFITMPYSSRKKTNRRRASVGSFGFREE
jgi:hypothetical protein